MHIIKCKALILLAFFIFLSPLSDASSGRQEFLKNVSVVTLSFSANIGIGKSLDYFFLDSNNDYLQNILPEEINQPEVFAIFDEYSRAINPTYSHTVFETHVTILCYEITKILIRSLGYKGQLGNPHSDELDQLSESNFLKSWLGGSIVAPLVEESIFRLFPFKILGSSWTVGTLSALVFAEAHNLGAETRSLPLQQFIGGLYFWYLMKNRGFEHAVLGHAINNNFAELAIKLDKILTHFDQRPRQCQELLSQEEEGR